MCNMALHSSQRWKVSECERPPWLSTTQAETSAKGSPVGRGTRGRAGRGEEKRDGGKGVRRRRGRSDICIRTLPVRWLRPLAGPGGQECAVVCGWDPPSSAPACPPSPRTSRLFIMNCGKSAALAVSSRSCKVYGILLTCKHAHNMIPAPSERRLLGQGER